MRSLSSLRQKFAQLSLKFAGRHAGCKSSKLCFSSLRVSLDGLLPQNTAMSFLLVNTIQFNSWRNTTPNHQPLTSHPYLTNTYYNKDIQLPQNIGHTSTVGDEMFNSVIGDCGIIGKFIGEIIGDKNINDVVIGDDESKSIIGDVIIGNDIMGYQPPVVSCSSVLKKRKQKMNKHKYKKRRKRDKFKRRNLENIKERKKRAREKADEREKAALA